MKQQTAVEWVAEMVSKMGYVSTDILEQAKDMEKEQIVKAFNQSWHDRMNPYKTAEKYYNETFGGNK